MVDQEKIFDFLYEVEGLKSTSRYTVTKSGFGESTAAHSWRLSLMTFLIAEELGLDIDVNHAVRIAIVHDIVESVVGDIDAVKVAEGEVSKEEKQRVEKEGMLKLKETAPSKMGETIFELWKEYEDCSSPEAKYVKALDKLETLTQLTETGHKMYDKPKLIANYANKAVKNFPALTDMLKIIKKKLRSEFEKGDIQWLDEYDSLD